MMNEHGKSDRPVVPAKSPNKAGQPAAEGTEGSGLTKGNPQQQNASRTPSRTDAPSALQRVRQAASKDKETRFTALLHHIYNLETLRMAYFGLKKEAAPGVDGETWRHYGETLEDNLQDLSHRLKRGAYRAKPVRRAYIDKSDGRTDGVPSAALGRRSWLPPSSMQRWAGGPTAGVGNELVGMCAWRGRLSVAWGASGWRRMLHGHGPDGSRACERVAGDWPLG